MKEKIKNIIAVALLGGLLLLGAAWCILKPADALSVAERRTLKQFPTLKWNDLILGEWMEDFDSYTLDQFPIRQQLRTVKAWVSYNLLGQMDNNGIYLADGSVGKLEYPLKENSIIKAADKLNAIRDKYLDGCKVYYAIIPDKNYYIAAQNGYPSMDYVRLEELFDGRITGMQKIALWDCLDIWDYYTTDTHWRQERLERVVNRLAQAMDFELGSGYEQETLTPFYGVYYGQAALPLEPDAINYLHNSTIDEATVYNFETGKSGGVYDIEKFEGMDGYDVFLSGACPLLTIENPNAKTDKELIIFRDSFGSSLAPLMIDGYKKITLVDIRYIVSDYVGQFIQFGNQDVLFLYSTLILNSSDTLR
ncbi:MAG: DHHW family protein [Eubacteriales bacterium]|nr:DHHW family protein [Eubacteriales bacterium]